MRATKPWCVCVRVMRMCGVSVGARALCVCVCVCAHTHRDRQTERGEPGYHSTLSRSWECLVQMRVTVYMRACRHMNK